MALTITCPCGHPMTAADDQELWGTVRAHIDESPPDHPKYTDDQIWGLIRAEATNV